MRVQCERLNIFINYGLKNLYFESSREMEKAIPLFRSLNRSE